MADVSREVVVDGLGYLEAARWHRGALWFSDIKNRTIPVSHHPNDLAVDREGRAYMSQFGYDLFGGGPPETTGLIVRHPDGRIEPGGGGLTFPNGLALSQDGRTLVTAESFSAPRTRVTAFDVREDGSLAGQRVFAEFGSPQDDVIDGVCMDAEGAVWVGCPFAGEFRRVVEGGMVTDTIVIPPEGGNYCVDCVLGGDDLRTLYLLVADTDVARLGNDWDSTARVEAVRVDVPGIDQEAGRA